MTATALVELRPGITGGRLSVGVAELTGLAAVRRFLDLPHLARVHASFEAVWRRVLAARGGLVVPRTDLVVYAVADAHTAVEAAQALVAEAAQVDLLPPVRVGVATGTVLLSEGRCYGPAVDTAIERMDAAAPGAVNRGD